MGILDRLLRRGTDAEKAAPPTPSAQRFEQFVEAARGSSWSEKFSELDEAKPILDSDPRDQIDTALLAVEFVDRHIDSLRTKHGSISYSMGDMEVQSKVAALASRLLQRGLPFTDRDFEQLLAGVAKHEHLLPVKAVLRAIEKQLDGAKPDATLEAALKRFRKGLRRNNYSEARKLEERVDAILAGPARQTEVRIEAVDAWTVALCGHIADDAARWSDLLSHCAKATSSKPSKRWLKEAASAVEQVGTDAHGRLLGTVLAAVGAKAPFPVKVAAYWGDDGWLDGHPKLVSDRYSDLLRGLVWSAVAGDLDSQLGAIGDAAERCFKKLAGHGPLAPKVGNACLFALSQASSLNGVGQLSRLKTRVKHASVRAQLDKALAAAAERAGLSQADLEDIAVPTCGLTGVGERIEVLGDFAAKLRLVGAGGTELLWRKESGKTQKSVPAAVKAEHAAELADLKKSAKELKKMLPAQRARIERMLLTQRTLPFADWRARYWEHPLVGYLARRLIWRIGMDGPLVTALDGQLVDIDGRAQEPDDAAPVALWHPIESPAETVRRWREWLADHGVTQPFKQAHREIYLLTDAERATETYSNRFAAHILKQHQFNALCRERGWHYTLQGGWDSHNTPYVDLPDHGLRVEYWVDPAGDLEAEMTEAAVYLYIATDQVRFYRMHEDGPMPIDQVPPIAFTEMMRDVDLFVGVCSVGNDPAWQDGGLDGRYRDYWNGYAFGELTESAKTRRVALERIVPKLKIADRCTLGDRFLSVRGELRTYHIHLGSGNIRMSPNDQYLCIVPGRKAGSAPVNVMLPFEGDSVLSIILSKAFLLAADKKIKDPTIVSQIKGR